MLPFIKMHGLGNDFVIFDARRKISSPRRGEARRGASTGKSQSVYRDRPLPNPPPVGEGTKITRARVVAIADRRFGVGCDQVIVLEGVRGQGSGVGRKRKKSLIPDPRSLTPDAFMRIFNADGSEAASCGNAVRCVAWLLMREKKKKSVRIETRAGVVSCERVGKMMIRADMGKPVLNWKEIPLARDLDTLKLPIAAGACRYPAAVSMGNPHMVFVCDDINKLPLQKIGPKLEHHPLYPRCANVGFAQVVNRSKVRLRVWERGAGETLACGTGACAAVVALHRKRLLARRAEVELPGGTLDIEWDEKSGRVFMTGPVEVSFEGTVDA